MSEYVAVPATVWRNLLSDLDYLKKVVTPLAKGYKPGKWMTAAETKEYLQIGDSRLKVLRASGQIQIRRPVGGKRIEYLRSDIEAYKDGLLVIETKK